MWRIWKLLSLGKKTKKQLSCPAATEMHSKVWTKDKHAGHSQESKGWMGCLSTSGEQRRFDYQWYEVITYINTGVTSHHSSQ